MAVDVAFYIKQLDGIISELSKDPDINGNDIMNALVLAVIRLEEIQAKRAA